MHASVSYEDANQDGIPDYSPDAIYDSLLVFLLGPDIFYDVEQVFFTTTVDDFSPLKDLPEVHTVHLWGPFVSGNLDVDTLESLPGLTTIEIKSDAPGFDQLDVDALRRRLPDVTIDVRNAHPVPR